MKRSLILLFLAALLPLALAPASVRAQSEPGYYTIADQGSYIDDELLYPEELDDLLAPIALYPDPLIAQILPAATFVDQIHDAAQFVRLYGNTSRIDYQPWDISVRAVAHYPQVLYMMDREYQWTASLGQAYIEQPQDVMDAIQRLRQYAREQGNLYSTRQQQVIYEGDIIRIVPAGPQLVYVPVYDPYVVYVERYYPSSPFITFSVGFSIGPWLNRDCDWRERRVYYHGWRGGGWVRRARPHIHDRRGIYINRRASTITINERVVQRDTRSYRERLRVESRRHRDEGRMPEPTVIRERSARGERPRPKAEPARPGKVEQPRPGSERRREPWSRRQPAPAPAQQAPVTAPPKAGTVTPPAVQRQPAPVQPVTPQAVPQTQPTKQQPQTQPQAKPGRQQPGRQQPEAQPGKQQPEAQPGKQPPAAAGERPAARPGRGEIRRREPRPVNQPERKAPAAPAVPVVPPTVVAPAPAAPAPDLRPHAPAAEPAVKAPAATPAAPAKPATPARPATPRPSVRPKPEGVPAPTVTPAPRAAEPAERAEPAEPARPAREAEPGQGRMRGGESSGGRMPRRGGEDR